MSKMIQVRNVPEALHRQLKARAAELGLSLSDFLLEELRRVAARPTRQDLERRLAGREPIRFETTAADLIREGRDEG